MRFQCKPRLFSYFVTWSSLIFWWFQWLSWIFWHEKFENLRWYSWNPIKNETSLVSPLGLRAFTPASAPRSTPALGPNGCAWEVSFYFLSGFMIPSKDSNFPANNPLKPSKKSIKPDHKKKCGFPLNLYLISNRRVPCQNPLNIAILLYEFEWTCNLWPMMANMGLHNPNVCFLSMTFKSSSFWLYETVTWFSSASSKQIIHL